MQYAYTMAGFDFSVVQAYMPTGTKLAVATLTCSSEEQLSPGAEALGVILGRPASLLSLRVPLSHKSESGAPLFSGGAPDCQNARSYRPAWPGGVFAPQAHLFLQWNTISLFKSTSFLS